MFRSEAFAAGMAMLFVVTSCTPHSCPQDTLGAAIWNGTPTDEFQPVGALTADGDAFCTGTLVDATSVLTAAHCVDYIESAAGAEIRFYTGAGDPGPLEGGLLVNDAVSHPDWDGWAADIGLVFLDESAVETPQFVNVEEMLPFHWEGERVTLVGYGITEDGLDDSGLKLMTEVEIYAFDEDVFFHYSAGTNACFGDSGGPALYEFEDGWCVVGVLSVVFGHLYKDSSCVGGGGYQIRTDLYADWLQDLATINTEPGDDDTADDDSDDDAAQDDDTTLPLDDEDGGCRCTQGPVGARGLGSLALLAALLLLRR